MDFKLFLPEKNLPALLIHRLESDYSYVVELKAFYTRPTGEEVCATEQVEFTSYSLATTFVSDFSITSSIVWREENNPNTTAPDTALQTEADD